MVVRHDVRYVAPLAFRLEPVKIACWVTEVRAASFTMAYEVYDEAPDGSAHRLPAGQDPAHAVRLRGGAAAPHHRRREGRPGAVPRRRAAAHRARAQRSPKHLESGHYPLHVRFSDVDLYGHVNNVKYFEYFQEARIRYLMRTSTSAARASAP